MVSSRGVVKFWNQSYRLENTNVHDMLGYQWPDKGMEKEWKSAEWRRWRQKVCGMSVQVKVTLK